MSLPSPQTSAVRVAVIVPILFRYDGISQAAVDTWRTLVRLPGVEASLIATASERDDLPVVIVPGVGGLLRAPEFLQADLVVYHFGLHHEIFDALLLSNGRGAKQIVRFHNVTPIEFLRPQDAPLIKRSFAQMNNFRHADAIWPESRTNLRVLEEQGIKAPYTDIIPPVVETPDRRLLAEKQAHAVEIVFVGRFVQSKGVLDLIEALGLLHARGGAPWRLRLVCNLRLSHSDYVSEVREAAACLGSSVEFLGTVDDPTRDRLLHEAHILAIPSYHEGFCKPVVEALRAGCIPVGYDAYNLPEVAAKLGRLVPPGDIPALATALGEVIEDVWAVAQGDMTRPLRLDSGPLPVTEFDSRARVHTKWFEFDAIYRQTAAAVRRLLPDAAFGHEG